MKFNQEFFSSEVVLQRLVEWFNSQPIDQRAIAAGEFVIIRVKVLVTSNGEPVFVIGSDPTDINDPSREYIGEATYIWVGSRGTDLTATTTSFFEISKYLNNNTTINIRPFNAVIKYPPPAPLVLRMAYGWMDPNNSESAYSIGLDGLGAPHVIPSSDPYINPPPTLKNVTDLATYGGAVAARRADGTVWGWGNNAHAVYEFTNMVPSQISFDLPVRRIVMLKGVLVALHDDGTISLMGDLTFTPFDVNTNPAWGSDWATGGFDGMMPNISDYTNIVDIKGYSRTSYGTPDILEQYVILQHADGHLITWGATFEYAGAWAASGGVLASINQSPITQVDTFEVNHGLLFVLHNSGEVSLIGADSSRYNVNDQVDGELVAKVAVTGNGSIGYVTVGGKSYVYPLDDIGQSADGWMLFTAGGNEGAKTIDMVGGQEHIEILTDGRYISGMTGGGGGIYTDEYLLDTMPRQIFAGNHTTAVLEVEGGLSWQY